MSGLAKFKKASKKASFQMKLLGKKDDGDAKSKEKNESIVR